MADQLLISVDIGTTACKAAIFTRGGLLKALSYKEYPLIKISAKQIEQDPEAWWELVKLAISECVERIKSRERSSIKALSISAQGISFVPVDINGKPLMNAISWLDSRAEDEARMLSDTIGKEEVYKTAGIQSNPVYILPKIMWLKNNKPDLYRRTDRFCTCLDYITHKFTGEYRIDYSIAGGSLLHDVQKLQWSDKLLEAAGITKDKLPGLDWAGVPVGKVLEGVSIELGLPKDMLVVLGGHDQECAGMGAGLQKGIITISLGTAANILMSTDQPLLDEKMRIPCIPSVERDKWAMEAVVSVGGAGLNWICELVNSANDICNQNSIVDYNVALSNAQTISIGSDGLFFYPHISGATSPYWIPSATGVFHGVSLNTSMRHMIRSVVEGWVFQLKTNLLVMNELGNEPKSVIIFGGGAKSTFIRQLVADILNKPVIITNTTETALLGACILAGIGCGLYSNIAEAQKLTIRSECCIEPDRENAKSYADIYEKYSETEKALLGI